MNNWYTQQGFMGFTKPIEHKNTIIQVSGINGANAYALPENSSVALFDNAKDILYIKSTDGAGFATIKQYSISEMDIAEEGNKYATKEDIKSLKDEMENMKNEFNKSDNTE